MTREELLLELKNIEAPVAPDWWLIAPVYLSGVILLLILVFAGWYLLRRKKVNQLVYEAEQALLQIRNSHRQHADDRLMVISLSEWIRQVSLMAFPDRDIAALCGRDWVEFLDQSTPEISFSKTTGQLFESRVYSRNPQVNCDKVLNLCEQWLSEIKPRLVAAI